MDDNFLNQIANALLKDMSDEELADGARLYTNGIINTVKELDGMTDEATVKKHTRFLAGFIEARRMVYAEQKARLQATEEAVAAAAAVNLNEELEKLIESESGKDKG